MKHRNNVADGGRTRDRVSNASDQGINKGVGNMSIKFRGKIQGEEKCSQRIVAADPGGHSGFTVFDAEKTEPIHCYGVAPLPSVLQWSYELLVYVEGPGYNIWRNATHPCGS